MIPGQEIHMSRLVIPNGILSSPLYFSPLFSFTRTTDSGTRLNPQTMSSALPPSHPWPTQFLAWMCFGLNSFLCLHWLVKTLERILLCSYERSRCLWREKVGYGSWKGKTENKSRNYSTLCKWMKFHRIPCWFATNAIPGSLLPLPIHSPDCYL